jgi:hypothetical protein
MSHSGHGSHGGGGGGELTDEDYAVGYWYGIAGCVGLLAVIRAANVLQRRRRLNLSRDDSHSNPSRPRSRLTQAYATATAITRESLYPQPVYFTGRFAKYFTPLPVGRWLLLIIYWIVLLSFLWENNIVEPNDPLYLYRWDKVGYRAAWVSVTQVPFLYLLSCKFNPITLLTGISYERYNWLHRWAARTLWLTTIVHWSFFYHSWSIWDIVSQQMAFMPMVKWGFAAWGVMTWMILTGFGFFRDLSYELFVIQHIAAAGVFLWVLFVHVPSKAAYNIWIAVAFLAFDWVARIIHGLLQNTHLLSKLSSKRPGYSTRLEPLPGDLVRVTVEGVDFSWKAGQHVYLNMPRIRLLESHPYTIANVSQSDSEGSKSLSMLIQARAGFSRSLLKAAIKFDGQNRSFRSFLSGPWGNPPALAQYETVVLIACSSGASFIMPLLHDLVRKPGCVRNVELHWIIREEDHLSWYKDELTALFENTRGGQLSPRLHVHITQPSSRTDILESIPSRVRSDTSSSDASIDNEKAPLAPPQQTRIPRSAPLIMTGNGRPTLDSLIRPAVESALGETAVVVCGSTSITAQSRTYVANLSDERAVHKGTGAQGIYLFTETYGW